MDQEAYNYYQRQKEIVDSWMQYDYINKLYNNLRFELVKINWTKKNYKALKRIEAVNKATYNKEFHKYINEVNDIIRKLKLVNANDQIKRARTIKQLTINLIKTINNEH